jgi:hypothetical protein
VRKRKRRNGVETRGKEAKEEEKRGRERKRGKIPAKSTNSRRPLCKYLSPLSSILKQSTSITNILN